MAKYTLASYAVRIRKSRDNDYLPLHNFDNAGGDLLKEFYGFLLSLQERPFEVQRKERSLEAHSIHHEGRSLLFKLGSGSFGTQSRIRERATGQVVFQKEEDHVDTTDLRNYLIIPQGVTAGLLFTERIQGIGVIATLSEAFRKAFNQKYSGYTLELNNMTSEAAFGVYLERGAVKKIRLVRQTIPDDVADVLGMGDSEKNLGSIELVMKPPRLSSFGKRKIQSVISGETDVSSMLEWRGLQYREMKIEVKVANSTRTLSVSSGTTPAMLYDLDTERQKDSQTEITDDWVYAKAKEFAEEVAENMGFDVTTMRRGFAWPELWEYYRLETPSEPND
ncbi:hypothetical protein AB0K74_31355 [Streptomyces sp. NPDC056159]|uniref:hypothetical protein n=1 Tax=Streptomyces sp. NPDC056159 TaxID=3155537 RepID=UPI003417EB94